MKKFTLFFIFVLCASNIFSQYRSFNEIFPNIRDDVRTAAFSSSGYVNSSQKKSGFTILGSDRRSGIHPQIINMVLNKNPGYIVESINVIRVTPGSVHLLDIYNVLGNVRGLRGRLYDSATRNRPVPLFEEATRITSERNTSAIPDPPAARVIPRGETVYIRLKDANFGNTFYRGEMALIQDGLRYTLSNFRSMNYFFIPVIGEGKFTAQLYFEPIQEGILIYGIAGIDMSDFYASQIHVESAIAKRLAVIIAWAAEGILHVNR